MLVPVTSRSNRVANTASPSSSARLADRWLDAAFRGDHVSPPVPPGEAQPSMLKPSPMAEPMSLCSWPLEPSQRDQIRTVPTLLTTYEMVLPKP